MSDIKIYTNQQLTKVGNQTEKVSVYKSESHKLHQSFPINETLTDRIITGSPVCLNTDGTIVSALYAAKNSLTLPMIGISQHDQKYPTYGGTKQGGSIECTVMVRGYAITIGEASGAIQAGYVEIDSAATLGERTVYKQATAETKFIAIETAAAGDLVQILNV